MVGCPGLYLVDENDAIPVRDEADLVAYFTAAAKPIERWRIGSEHELVGVRTDAGVAPGYEPRGIRALLEWFAARGGDPVLEDGHPIAVARGDAQLTIEPGGQFELAARPVADDRDFATDLKEHVAALGEASSELGLSWLACGLRPFGARDDVPWMPKQRYDVMRDYMPTVGTRGLDMMLRTATVQANLDFADEADAAAKLRCLYSITSLLTALFAASPIADDRASGFQSYRAWIWRDVDRARAGLLPFVFERDDAFTAYTQWALDVPMYFVFRGGYRRVPAGLTFRAFMRDGWHGERATRNDWALHLSTLFPEGRLKRVIEVRGCDCGSLGMIAALAPLLRGVLYDADARAAAAALTRTLSFVEREQLADDVPRLGLSARAGTGPAARSVGDMARELVAIAKAGLTRIAPASVSLIAPVEVIAATGRTQADRIAELWQRHAGDRAALVKALAHPGLGG
jgi:glutamate--cysteine ligase